MFGFFKRKREASYEPISHITDSRREELIAEVLSEREACTFRIDEIMDELGEKGGRVPFFRRIGRKK